MNKSSELSALVAHRQASQWEGYGCIGDYQNGLFECDFVSPYTKGPKTLTLPSWFFYKTGVPIRRSASLQTQSLSYLGMRLSFRPISN